MCGVGATGPSLSSLPTFRSFLPFPRGFHPSLLADVATCDARSRIRHVSHITLFLLGDGRTRTEEEGLGAAGEVAAAEPAMIPDGEKLDANRHATNGGSRRGTAWSSNGAGESRMRMREIPGIHGGDDDERRWRRTRDFQADTRRALTQVTTSRANVVSSAAPV